MKLELKHLAPYLPYDLNVINCGVSNKVRLSAINLDYHLHNQSKPILRPLCELTVDFIYNCGIDGGFEDLHIYSTNYSNGVKLDKHQTQGISYATYDDFSLLFKLHFDIFRLIEKGLAIDINTLNK